MPANDRDGLERIERASSLLRNIVIILGALTSAALFLSGVFASRVRVQEQTMSIDGSKFLVSDRDTTGKLGHSAAGGLSAEDLAKYFEKVGRLDVIHRVTIKNETKEAVELLVRVKVQRRAPLLDPTDAADGAFMQSQFVLTEASSRCPINDDPLTLTPDGFILPEATGSVEIKRFPAGCDLTLQLFRARAPSVVVSVFVNGRLQDFERAALVFGGLGSYLLLVTEDPPWSLLMYFALPAFWMIVVCAFGWSRVKAAIVSARATKPMSGTLARSRADAPPEEASPQPTPPHE